MFCKRKKKGHGFLRVLWFSPAIKLTAEILLKAALNTITLTLTTKKTNLLHLLIPR